MSSFSSFGKCKICNQYEKKNRLTVYGGACRHCRDKYRTMWAKGIKDDSIRCGLEEFIDAVAVAERLSRGE